jgi:hypothetical protein
MSSTSSFKGKPRIHYRFIVDAKGEAAAEINRNLGGSWEL